MAERPLSLSYTYKRIVSNRLGVTPLSVAHALAVSPLL